MNIVPSFLKISSNSSIPKMISTYGGYAGVAAGLLYRYSQGIEPAFKIMKGVAANNVCANRNFSVMPLNVLNSGMQFLAKNPIGWGIRAAIPLGLCAAAYYNSDSGVTAKLAKLAGAVVLVAGVLNMVHASVGPVIPLVLGFSEESSGHIMMMSAVGLAIGLADKFAGACQKEAKWTWLKSLTSACAVTYGVANAAFLFNTSACFHTVAESLEGIVWINSVALATSLAFR